MGILLHHGYFTENLDHGIETFPSDVHHKMGVDHCRSKNWDPKEEQWGVCPQNNRGISSATCRCQMVAFNKKKRILTWYTWWISLQCRTLAEHFFYVKKQPATSGKAQILVRNHEDSNSTTMDCHGSKTNSAVVLHWTDTWCFRTDICSWHLKKTMGTGKESDGILGPASTPIKLVYIFF